MAYTVLGNSCVYLLACNQQSEFVPCHAFFVWKKDQENFLTYLNFRRNLAWELIDNPILKQSRAAVAERRMMLHNEHKPSTLPTHAKRFKRGWWDCSNKQPRQQYTCRTFSCDKTIQTYCSCSVGEWMCKDCYGQHMEEVTQQIAEGGNWFIILIILIFHVM